MLRGAAELKTSFGSRVPDPESRINTPSHRGTEDLQDQDSGPTQDFEAGHVSNQRVEHKPQAIKRTSAAIIAVYLLSVVVVGQVAAPRRIKDVRPVYPSESLQAGDEGVILLELNVTPSGTVGQVRLLRSECKRLEQAALTAVRQWQFEQWHVNGTPVPFTVVADVPFRLPTRFKERTGRTGACKWKEPLKPIYE